MWCHPAISSSDVLIISNNNRYYLLSVITLCGTSVSFSSCINTLNSWQSTCINNSAQWIQRSIYMMVLGEAEEGRVVVKENALAHIKEWLGMYTPLYSRWVTTGLSYSTWTLLSVICRPRREEGLGGNGYMCVYGWVHSLLTWNYHNIANWLHLNTKKA